MAEEMGGSPWEISPKNLEGKSRGKNLPRGLSDNPLGKEEKVFRHEDLLRMLQD